jgi:hypothetical protein
MGHATHFLRRIERLSPVHADLALSLYRSPPLVKHLLRRVSLPDGAERVALALENGPDSPHVIVTRDGHFVTCLGAGMVVNDCARVSRVSIDRAGERIEELRAVRAGERGDLRRLNERMLEHGSALTREELLALAALMPIVGGEYLATIGEMSRYLLDIQWRYRRERYRKLTPALRDALRIAWAHEWAIGHLVAICGERLDDLEWMCKRVGRDHHGYVESMVKISTYSMSTPAVIRGAWLAIRAGRLLLPWLCQRLQGAPQLPAALAAGIPLVGIGLRYRSAQAEVAEALALYRQRLQTTPELFHGADFLDSLFELFEKMFEPDTQASLRRHHVEQGAIAYAAAAARMPADSPLRFTRAEDVPEDLALSALANHDGNIYGDYDDLQRLLITVPWLATASAAELYLPARTFTGERPVFDAELALQRIDGFYRYSGIHGPRQVAVRPGRNEPCPCGSGKKYKRCHGAAA